MSIELKVPPVGESITEVQIGPWLKREGELVQRDESLVEIESDKATMELPSPIDGTIVKILKRQGETARVGEVIGYMDENGAAGIVETRKQKSEIRRGGPEARNQKAETRIADSETQATAPVAPSPQPVAPAAAPVPKLETPPPAGAREEVVPMSLIRRRIAERLVEAQQTAALLTSVNEIDMSAVVALRREFREAFEKQFGVRLGLMSFFVKAVIDALKQFPAVNAEIRGTDIVYRNHYDIGIAVSGRKGLVVPVLHDAERLSFAEIERAIADFGRRAADNQLKVEELTGGTFTITNGGVFGSLLSTPIVNPPQSGILGMHAIQDRPVARDGQVVIRPMMYVALTYDHRVIDGREAVGFLVRVKQAIEQPARMLLEI